RGRQLAQRSRNPGRSVAVLYGDEGPDEPPAPAAPAQAGQDVVARLPTLAGDDPDGPGQRRARQALLGLEQPLVMQAAAQAFERDQQVALAGESQLGDREGEGGGGGAAPRVVIAAAADDDAHPVGEGHAEG